MATQQNNDAVFKWLGGLPWTLRFVFVSLAAAAMFSALLLKFQNQRDIPAWDMSPNRDGHWTVVEHPDGTADVSRGIPRVSNGDVKSDFVLTIKARVIGTVNGDQANALTVWLERAVKAEPAMFIRKQDRLDPATEKRLLGHVAARFTDPDLAALIAAGGGTTSRNYWGWLNTFLSMGMGVAAFGELLVWYVRRLNGQRRTHDDLVENEA